MNVGALSGESCIERLLALGFTVFHKGGAVTLLARGKNRVLVPHIEELGRDMLDGILRSAGITEGELRASLRRSGFVRVGAGGSGTKTG
jgi:predicted RNA binding protein YcfA (HicA-like mRNA interferase family)